VLLSIANSAPQPADLGFLLHKNPANLNTVDLSFGKAHVFYTGGAEECTANLLLEIDPVELVRGGCPRNGPP
jgi:hypothetical protein